MLIVDTYEIEFCPGCACDYLTYGDKEKDLQNGYRRRCNFYSKNSIAFLKLTSVGSLATSNRGDKELWLRFHSDHSAEFKGLKGKLRVIYRDNDCNNYLNDTSGSIVSPKYPSQYLKSQTITWCLMVPHGFRVKLKFTTFELENTVNKDNDCLNDYVEVRDGGYGGYGELLGRFCGNTIPDEIYSLSNQMWVVFVSDNNAKTNYKGFKADFVNGEMKVMYLHTYVVYWVEVHVSRRTPNPEHRLKNVVFQYPILDQIGKIKTLLSQTKIAPKPHPIPRHI